MTFQTAKLIYIVPWIPAFLLAVFVCLPWARPRLPGWIFVTFGYIILDATITIEAPHIPGTHWNWIGKGASFILALVIIAVLRPPTDATALRWPQHHGERQWAIFGILGTILFASAVNFAFRNYKPVSFETILYQATMPGLAEEFCWRGVVFLFLGRAYASVDGKPNLIPAAFISTLIFGLAHGVSLDNGSPHFAWLAFLYASLLGAWLALLRLRVRSLGILVAAHNFGNVAGALVGAIP
jgi:membrane protease YdiL (CAAX protease family)